MGSVGFPRFSGRWPCVVWRSTQRSLKSPHNLILLGMAFLQMMWYLATIFELALLQLKVAAAAIQQLKLADTSLSLRGHPHLLLIFSESGLMGLRSMVKQ